MLQAADTGHFNPLVPKAHNSDKIYYISFTNKPVVSLS